MATTIMYSFLLITAIAVLGPTAAFIVPGKPVSRAPMGVGNSGACPNVCIPSEHAADQQCKHRSDCTVVECSFLQEEGFKCGEPVGSGQTAEIVPFPVTGIVIQSPLLPPQ